MKQATPAMRQYLDMKASNADSILFFRMGDFYEMFYDDARLASRLLGIALTSRDREKSIPMCGVPYHAASGYIARLVREGHKVAVCEQTTLPEAGGIVERQVVKVVTPGIAFEDELLDPKSNNYIAAVYEDASEIGLAYMDASTGEFKLTELTGLISLADEVRRIGPLEVLLPEGSQGVFINDESSGWTIKKSTYLVPRFFDYDRADKALCDHFGVKSMEGFGCAQLPAAMRAAGALLQYAKDTQKSTLLHLKAPSPYRLGDHVVIDNTTLGNLEVLRSMRTGGREGTLLDLLDKTKTAFGARLLRSWLVNPLKNVSTINSRLDAVEELVNDGEMRSNLAQKLKDMYDLERLSARVMLRTATPKDLIALRDTLSIVPELKAHLSAAKSKILKDVCAKLEGAPETCALLKGAINDSPPYSIRDGGIIRPGYDPSLDELREVSSGGKDWVARLEASERARTGINSLKVGFNRVFGYYIEITKSNLRQVPSDYTRKQTLANAERYVTPELKAWEDRILGAEEKSVALESKLYMGILDKVAAQVAKIQRTAEQAALLDVLANLAAIARSSNYTRPIVNDSNAIEITGGRHPVVEAIDNGAGATDFVPNDLRLDEYDCRMIILTGPNMAGKSTYLRQNAIIVLLSHIGSFVPAERAIIGAVDRIFTRVGASDDLGRGQSTFMVEMMETANILNNTTGRSFVILDEIGRGTATFDGLSIAWAVAEYLHDAPGVNAKTIFATHYHELTELSLTKERVKNYNMAVREWNDKIVFLKKVVPGGANRSYGIQVARLAGLPERVIVRAKEILANLERGELNESGAPRLAIRSDGNGYVHDEEARYAPLLAEKDPVHEAIEKIDVDAITPIDALNALAKIKGMLKK